MNLNGNEMMTLCMYSAHTPSGRFNQLFGDFLACKLNSNFHFVLYTRICNMSFFASSSSVV